MPEIHPTALVSEEAVLADDVTVGPFTNIDGPAVIGPGCRIGGHAWIHGKVEMGPANSVGYGTILGGDPQDLSFDPETPSGVRLGEGNRLREYVTVHRSSRDGGWTTVGDGNYLMTGAHLGHDVILGDKNILANNVLLGGHVEVGNCTFIGGASTFHQFVRIGDYVMVQGLTGSSKDVPPYCILRHGNTLSGLNVVGMRRAGFTAEERNEIKSAYAQLFQSGLNANEALEEAAKRQWSRPAAKLVEAVRNPGSRGVLTRIERGRFRERRQPPSAS